MPTSRLTLHVQNFVIWIDQISEFCGNCNLMHALLRLYLTPCTRWFCLLTDFTIVIFRIMKEHIAVSSSLGTDDTFLALGIFCQRILSRIGDHWGKIRYNTLFFDNFTLGITTSFRNWRRCISYFKSFWKWLEQIQHCVLHFLSSLKISLGCREIHGW